jgi:hypothetical protein
VPDAAGLGYSTRTDNIAVAAVKHQAIDKAVKEVETANTKQLAVLRADAAKDKREAVRRAKRETRRNERNRVRSSQTMREQGYSSAMPRIHQRRDGRPRVRFNARR